MTIPNLGLMTGNYTNLNGLSGYGYGYGGGYGFGTANDGVTQRVKHSVKNNYEIAATRNAYNNMPGIEEKNYNQECLTINELMKAGRSDDVVRQFNNIVTQMKNSPAYSAYSVSQLKTLARDNYKKATGTDILVDAEKYCQGGFLQGIAEGVPITGTFFYPSTSKEDVMATVTNVPKNGAGVAEEMTGAVTTGALGGASMGIGTLLAKNAYDGSKATYKTEGLKLTKIVPGALKFSNLTKNLRKSATKFGLLGALVGTGLAVAKSLNDVK